MKSMDAYEKSGFRSRLRETGMLSLIIIISFLISLIVMDIIIFPIAFLAVKNSLVFTYLFKCAFWVLISAVISYIIIKMIYQMRKDGFPASYIFKNIILKPLQSLVFILAVFLAGLMLILFLHLIYQNNYRLLNKLLNV